MDKSNAKIVEHTIWLPRTAGQTFHLIRSLYPSFCRFIFTSEDDLLDYAYIDFLVCTTHANPDLHDFLRENPPNHDTILLSDYCTGKYGSALAAEGGYYCVELNADFCPIAQLDHQGNVLEDHHKAAKDYLRIRNRFADQLSDEVKYECWHPKLNEFFGIKGVDVDC